MCAGVQYAYCTGTVEQARVHCDRAEHVRALGHSCTGDGDISSYDTHTGKMKYILSSLPCRALYATCSCYGVVNMQRVGRAGLGTVNLIHSTLASPPSVSRCCCPSRPFVMVDCRPYCLLAHQACAAPLCKVGVEQLLVAVCI